MSAAGTRRGAWGGSSGDRRVIGGDAAMLIAVMAVAVFSAWPIYATWALPATALLALAGGMGVAAWLRRSPRRLPVGVLIGVLGYLIPALLAGAPSALDSFPDGLLRALRAAVTGPVTVWRELLTVRIPVGTFESLLIGFLIPAYLGSLAAWAALRSSRPRWGWAVPALVPLLAFGIVFGAAVPSAPLRLGPLTVPAGREVAVGLLQLFVVLVWLRWRRSAGSSAAVSPRVLAGSAAGVALIVVLALSAGVVGAPGLLASSARDVPRAVVKPEVRHPADSSPLSAFRANFASDRLHRPLLRVSGADRVRFASLPVYTGAAFVAGGGAETAAVGTDRAPEGAAAGGYVRVPTALDPPGGTSRTATITIDGYSSSWVPLPGALVSAGFRFPNGSERFYYDDAQGAGFLSGTRLGTGDSYTVVYRMQTAAGADILGPGPGDHSGVTDQSLPHLEKWVQAQHGRATVAGVRQLIAQLMLRSYLGHSRDLPTGDATWMPAGYRFRASDAGQNAQRIEAMFADMLSSRFQDCTQGRTQCAATVGDQEQYATAGALVARAVGFPSRVVLGAKVRGSGTVTGADVTAWVEIRAADGRWVPIDIVPRTDNEFVEDQTTDTYRQYAVQVPPQSAQRLDAPEAHPAGGGGSQSSTKQSTATRVWDVVFAVLRVLLLVALLASPIWGMLLVKALRRTRRRRGSPEVVVRNGWRQYVDDAIDRGQTPPGNRTRKETAALYDTDAGARLAAWADRAQFAGAGVTEDEARSYWAVLHEDSRGALAGRSTWRRWLARWSPRSLLRSPWRSRRVARLPWRRPNPRGEAERGAGALR